MCGSEVPDLENLWNTYKDQDFVLLGIDSGDSYATVTSWLDDLGGVTFPVLLDSGEAVYRQYQLTCNDAYAPYPRQLILDQAGVIQYTACNYYADRVTATLDALLAP